MTKFIWPSLDRPVFRLDLLDLVITSSDFACSITHCSPSDHFPVFTKLSVDCTPPPSSNVPLILPSSLHRYRLLSFWLQCSWLITNPLKSLGSLQIAYSVFSTWQTCTSQILLSQVASLNLTLGSLSSTIRHAENIWKLCSWLVLFHIFVIATTTLFLRHCPTLAPLGGLTLHIETHIIQL